MALVRVRRAQRLEGSSRFLGGAAASLPLTARAQQSSEMRRVAVLSSGNADDQLLKSALAASQQRLQQLGGTDGQNLRQETLLSVRRGKGGYP
jgi:hypothetical protein